MNPLTPNTAVQVGDIALEQTAVSDAQSIDGAPRTGATSVATIGGVEVGVWEMMPGVMRDVEADEVFIVLSGSATVEFADGSTTLQLRAGDLARLAEGAETIWTVTETVRKVYLTPTPIDQA